MPDAVTARADHSRFVQRIGVDSMRSGRCWPPAFPTSTRIRAGQALQQHGRSLPSALRVARQLVLERLAVLDVEQGATRT
jgi:glutamate-ammonia-ligase adenylyltransferase